MPSQSDVLDRAGRDRAAELLRKLADGEITTDEFADSYPMSDDRGVRAMRQAGWLLYDDLREHKLIGKDALPAEGKAEVARWILFLRTDDDFLYPLHEGLSGCAVSLLSLFTLGQVRIGKWTGDYFPFQTKEDFERAFAEFGTTDL
ncbi:MAG: hypothetical protein K1X53_16215 [Candidatus Sumerlaeaceae bacterium]|nr:hypothetical protein [Candidatus Sumerlaeaceae bacterium]